MEHHISHPSDSSLDSSDNDRATPPTVPSPQNHGRSPAPAAHHIPGNHDSSSDSSDDERPFRIKNAPYGLAQSCSRSKEEETEDQLGEKGKEAEVPFGEKEEAKEEAFGQKEGEGEKTAGYNGETTTKKVCFETDAIFNEPRIPHTLFPPHASQGNRTHTYAVNALEVHDFLTQYWNSQDECFEDDYPYASGDDRANNEDPCDSYPPPQTMVTNATTTARRATVTTVSRIFTAATDSSPETVEP